MHEGDTEKIKAICSKDPNDLDVFKTTRNSVNNDIKMQKNYNYIHFMNIKKILKRLGVLLVSKPLVNKKALKYTKSIRMVLLLVILIKFQKDSTNTSPALDLS